MKIFYIFPHPDDESFGPALAMSAQLRAGHEVHLLTLTKGEATSQRHRLGVSKQQMGEIRFKEMQCVEKVLGLSGMTVLNLPDNNLKNLDPIEIGESIESQIKSLEPEVLVTYAVHGISGFHDHLVCHAVVKHVFCKIRREGSAAPRRLAFFTRMGEVNIDGKFRLEASSEEEIDCIVHCNDLDMKKFNQALDCYKTYREVIEASGVREVTTNEVPFEFFQENYKTPVDDIAYGL